MGRHINACATCYIDGTESQRNQVFEKCFYCGKRYQDGRVVFPSTPEMKTLVRQKYSNLAFNLTPNILDGFTTLVLSFMSWKLTVPDSSHGEGEDEGLVLTTLNFTIWLLLYAFASRMIYLCRRVKPFEEIPEKFEDGWKPSSLGKC